MFRKLQALVASKEASPKQSDFELIESTPVNRFFYLVFNLERIIFQKNSLPFGVSILALWQKR